MSKIKTEDFRKSINSLSKTVGGDSILVEFKKDKIVLTTINAMQSAECSIKVDTGIEQKSFFKYSTLKDLVNTITSEEIEIVEDEKKVKILEDGGEIVLNTMDPSSLAVFPDIDPIISFSLPLKDFKKYVLNTIFASSDSSNAKESYKGMYLSAVNGKLSFVATDGICLAINEFNAADIKDISMIIPSSTLDIVSKIIPADSENINIKASKSMIEFSAGDMRIASLLINDKYPDYNAVLSLKSDKFFINVDSDALKQALSLVNVMAKKSSNRMIFTFNKDNMQIESTDGIEGKVSKSVAYESSIEEPIKVVLTTKILEGISHTEGKTIKFSIEGGLRPIFINGDASEYHFITMPQKQI